MMAGDALAQEEDVTWNPDNPNVLEVRLGGSSGGMKAATRVTRRSEDWPAAGAKRRRPSNSSDQ